MHTYIYKYGKEMALFLIYTYKYNSIHMFLKFILALYGPLSLHPVKVEIAIYGHPENLSL